ncbi:MAG: hypothetical protein ACYDDV_00425 [Methanoregula sp.]
MDIEIATTHAKDLSMFRQLPQYEQDRLMAESAREILANPAAMEEFIKILAGAMARRGTPA